MNDAQRFARLKEIYLKAQELSGEERRSWLDRECAGDEAFRAEVDALLENRDGLPELLRTGGAIEDFLKRGPREDAEPPAPPAAPERIGDYEIEGVLGEGGMGIVYKARQENPRRLVALKVIRSGPTVDEQQIKMFRREELALAQLKHPGIASIYAAGRTEAGQHYFAMELVRGVAIDTYFKSGGAKLDTAGRLRLFVRICRAISHAHQAGIIHRDLKPSNILVQTPGGSGEVGGSQAKPSESPSKAADGSRSEPEIKVLDFGLAKITDADVTLMSLASEAGRVQGTLAYMSPEQARGDPAAVDLRTDVYALGVILFEMLTGKRPYTLHPFLVPQAVRTICEQEPTRPGSVDRALRGDLEVILLKALEKDRERRYQSVAALAEDIDRYLAGQPILARPPSATYQFRKLVARHTAPFVAAGVVFLLLIAFGVTMAVMYRVQSRERLRAEASARKAERINELLQNMLASPNPWAGERDITVREVLEAEAGKIEEELADDPEVLAEALATIGHTYRGLAMYDEAERFLRAGLEARREFYGERHAEVALGLNGLGHLLLAKGDIAGAESTLTAALEMGRDLPGEDHPEVAVSLDLLAGALVSQARQEEAIEMYREALAIRRRIHPPDHPDVAASLNSLAYCLWSQSRPDEAEPFYREALALATEAHGEDHLDVATMTDNLALVLGQLGKVVEAESLHRKALAARTAHLGEEHPLLGVSWANLGSALEMQGRYDEAEEAFRRSTAVLRGVFGNSHPFTGLALTNLSYCLHRTAQYDSAEAYYRETIAVQEGILEDDNPDLNLTRELLATLLIDTARAEEAEPLLRSVATKIESSLPEDHWRHDAVRCRLAWCCAAEGRVAEADWLMHETRATILAIPNIRWRMDFLRRNAALYRAWGRPEDAAVYSERLEEVGV